MIYLLCDAQFTTESVQNEMLIFRLTPCDLVASFLYLNDSRDVVFVNIDKIYKMYSLHVHAENRDTHLPTFNVWDELLDSMTMQLVWTHFPQHWLDTFWYS